MSRIIYFGVDLHGHVNCAARLLEKLVDEGNEVFYFCNEPFREKIESIGAHFCSYQGLVNFTTYPGGGIDTFILFTDFILEKSQAIVENLSQEVEALQPDIIIHDAFCHWGKEFAHRFNLPGIALFTHYPFIDEMALLDPVFFSETILKAQDDPLYQKQPDKTKFYKSLMSMVSRRMAKKFGGGPLNLLNDVFGAKEGLNLIFSSREFQLHSEAFDESYFFAGYSIEAQLESIDFPWDSLDERPLIYVSFGTIFNETQAFYQKCIDAFGNSNKQLVISIGNKLDVNDFPEVPENVTLANYVPQIELLKRADVFISHGGTNSVYEAICCSVPLLTIPQAFDQFLGGQMIQASGIGIDLEEQEITAELLRHSVNTLLDHPSFVHRCQEVKASFESTGGMEMVVEKINNHVQRFKTI